MSKEAVDQRKVLKGLLDRTLSQVVPEHGPSEFERKFGLAFTPDMVGITFGELLIKQLVFKACSGNSSSIQEILDRLVGKPVQTAEIKTVSHTYNEFLLSCVEADQKEKHKIIDVPVIEQPETDLLKDLL